MGGEPVIYLPIRFVTLNHYAHYKKLRTALLSTKIKYFNILISIYFNTPKFNGGAKGVRTPDLYTASVALSQLSYSPKKINLYLPH